MVSFLDPLLITAPCINPICSMDWPYPGDYKKVCGVKITPDINPIYGGFGRSYPRDSIRNKLGLGPYISNYLERMTLY